MECLEVIGFGLTAPIEVKRSFTTYLSSSLKVSLSPRRVLWSKSHSLAAATQIALAVQFYCAKRQGSVSPQR